MPNVHIWLIAALGLAQIANAGELRLVQRDIKAITNGYEITVGVDFTGEAEPVAVWQLACQIIPSDLNVAVAKPEHNYLFSGSDSDIFWVGESFLCYGFGTPPQTPVAGSNLVQIDLTSNSGGNFDFSLVFLPYNDEDQSGSCWYSADEMPHPFVPEPSCYHMLLCAAIVFLITMADRNRWGSRTLSTYYRKIAGCRDRV
jgi:hypothetical protein